MAADCATINDNALIDLRYSRPFGTDRAGVTAWLHRCRRMMVVPGQGAISRSPQYIAVQHIGAGRGA
jgi:hypothetical protein